VLLALDCDASQGNFGPGFAFAYQPSKSIVGGEIAAGVVSWMVAKTLSVAHWHGLWSALFFHFQPAPMSASLI